MQICNCGTNARHSVPLKILLIDQIHHHLHHDILFLGLALGYHQSEGYKRVVCQPLGAVRTIEDAIIVEKP